MHDEVKDYYEVLQVSPNADPDTITRVFRLLAQRYHPDNPETGNEARFRELLEAHATLHDPVQRAQYDATYGQIRRERWRFVARGAEEGSDVAGEQQLRMKVLEILYARRRLEPHRPGLSVLDLAELMGTPLEHLDFAAWYLVQRQLVVRNDQSDLAITAAGVDAVEESRAPRPDVPRQLSEHVEESGRH